MTYFQRLSLFVIIDSCIVLSAISISTLIINVELILPDFELTITSFTILLCHHFFSIRYNLYKRLWEYASIGELIVIFKVVTYSILITFVLQQFILQQPSSRVLLVTWLLHLFLIGGSRFLWRLYLDRMTTTQDHKVRTLIVGAGSAGIMVARQILKKNEQNLLPVAFIDDNPQKQHLDILGIPVVGGVKDIINAVEKYKIDNIIIAIPSLSRKQLKVIFQECIKTSTQTKILPALEDLITGRVSVNEFRDVKLEELLGREPVQLEMKKISKTITNKVVLVTGAGGSIGSEITRQIAMFLPKQLILLGHGENSIYNIELELKSKVPFKSIDIVPEIADIKDEKKINSIIASYAPDIIYHAAAHKHVPLMEQNPDEAVKNNVIGTMNVAKAASNHRVKTFVMLSTDKAVNPTSVMGATKRLAEIIIQNMNQNSYTKFVTVRFGNVLGSRGSVIPLFEKQIKEGGPVTVTHPEMVRYFMTIPEASKLVIQAGSLAKGGEIFVLDMGEPVKIVDVAKNLIKLSGHSVEEIGIKYTGIRPGEKLMEELLQKEEVHEKQIFPKIYVGKTISTDMKEIEMVVNNLDLFSKEQLRKKLNSLANYRAQHIEHNIVSNGGG
ncbi:polysaccharide biosynthesis protein [Ornithinibacillus halotolerans]|uniref:UDP-N-acetylglucosamine 4,6-dehydratase n=1 Tax=Ornithinibacillus halotolerans TaxID=1274357 RepID=A0A916RYE1_9BACI|nr:nucleoside-diphosphate sugar epimerase/dehydratase [Ornithinibacillus halotolerans]GGA72852.1 UDP-N-acetylglucosamine 4,6-dehydratase [Ornithinibacillus halotolerans]